VAVVATVLPGAAASPSSGGGPDLFGYEILSVRPHDVEAFTQGLVFDDQGRMFESTGLVGETTLRELDPATGAVVRSVEPEDPVFGEGLALVGDRLLQLTWQEGIALAWDVESFALEDTFEYDGEGWGLCLDGDRLVMSDGTDTLTFRDPETFQEAGNVRVTLEGQPVRRLNELECVEGDVWANVWETDSIVRIDPRSGVVTGVLDASRLITPHPVLLDEGAVLNGIAHEPTASTDTLWLTGKHWPSMFEVRLIPEQPGALPPPSDGL
jgi:glutaminyl-peptide cyclotransferase